MTEEKKLGIEECLDITAFVKGVLQDAKKHKADDGKIDTMESIQMSITNAPEAVKAFVGWKKAIEEAKDLDPVEAQKLAADGMEIAELVVQVFFPKKADENK